MEWDGREGKGGEGGERGEDVEGPGKLSAPGPVLALGGPVCNHTSYKKVELTVATSWPLDYNVE